MDSSVEMLTVVAWTKTEKLHNMKHNTTAIDF